MKRFVLPVAVIAAALAIAGCGSSSGTSSSTGSTSAPPSTASAAASDHNAADVTFAQMMIPHHQQAIEMAQLAETRAATPELKTLASQIRGAQDPEINQMKGWLAKWGEPTAMPGGMSHGSMSGMSSDDPTSGMMSTGQMTALQRLSGIAFDREFLTMMTAHHRGAIEMARTEQANGRYEPAKTMAADIVRTQSDEVTKMASLLNSLPPEK